jgi:phenylalanyl-tRNA synthetase beta chain
MKSTLSWLKDHLDTKASVAEIADTLTRIGLEVEEVFDPATALASFKVAKVLKCEKHPNADKLQVCEVDTGTERLQVVCGAPNAREGLKGVFAPVGSYVPGIDLTLTKAKIRGVESNGMLLSERELELSDEHTGIIELAPDAKAGSPAAKALGLDDAVIEIAITPNRPDCLGVRGVARDLAAAGLGKLKADTVKAVKGSFPNPVPIKLEFDKETASACPVFAGRVVRGVKNGPSPEWLQRRLKAIGLRPINALVDITNYISYDRGRPLHVYDADKLKDPIRARLGREGESFKALDGKTYAVDADMCVIADDSGVLGLGGVIGVIPASPRRQPTSSSSRSFRSHITAARTKPGIRRTRAFASSAASIPISWCPGSSLRPISYCKSAVGPQARSRSRASRPSPPSRSNSISLWSSGSPGSTSARARSSGCLPRSTSPSTARGSTSTRRPPPGARTSPRPPISSRKWCVSPASIRFPQHRCGGRQAWRAPCSPRRRGGSGSPGACSLRAGWSRP